MSHRPSDDPAQADRAWAGYHPRAAVPSLAVAAVLSLIIWTGHWYLVGLTELADRIGVLAVFALAWCVWPALALVYLYRAVTYTYRITDRALLLDFGFWFRPVPPVWLHEVAEVRAGAGWFGRMLGVGWVDVQTAARVVRLLGVRHPEAFAEQLRAAVKQARSGGEEPQQTVN